VPERQPRMQSYLGLAEQNERPEEAAKIDHQVLISVYLTST
jgi:hypothetical protein